MYTIVRKKLLPHMHHIRDCTGYQVHSGVSFFPASPTMCYQKPQEQTGECIPTLYTHTSVVSQRSDHQPEDAGLQVAQAWKQWHDSLKFCISEVAAASMPCELPHAVPGIKRYSLVEMALHFQAVTPLPGKRYFSDSPSKCIPRNQASKWREREEPFSQELS